MPAISQRIDNYLGGVSRQSDDKKLPGQVKECLNGYPDPTFGLTKRPGFKWIKNLGTGTTYDNSRWFYIARTKDERYIGCITPKPNSGYGDIDIWNVDGTPCTVHFDALPWAASTAYKVGDRVINDSGKMYQCDTEGTSAGSGGPTGTGSNISDGTTQWDYVSGLVAQSYLSGSRLNYEVLTVQDTSIITNNLVTVAKQADPTFLANRKATVVLSGSPMNNVYTIVIDNNTLTHTSNASGTYDSILTAFENAIDALNISGLSTDKYRESLQFTDDNSTISISATGGQAGDSMYVFLDQVDNVTQLPEQTFHGHLVKVINTNSAEDTYWAKFVADNGTSGAGYWSEGLDPALSPGLDASTMPHELVNTETNVFVFRQVIWTERGVGDDKTNSHPSFVGKKIQSGFFYGNRLGFLADDNISMSQSQEFFNFYHTSAQTVTDADPIDLIASTIKPATLHSVLPTTQGLLLFSKDQQFLLSSADGVLTPTTTNVRAISNYDMDTDINPVDMGGIIKFLSKTPSYTRTFGMQTFGQDENPKILDIGRVVNEWVPDSVDTLIASPQNKFIAMSDQTSRFIYFYRTYHDGKETLLEAWFNWQLPGTVQTIAVDSDDFFAVTKQGSQFTLSQSSLSQSPADAIIVNNDGQKINPCIDLYTTASNVAGNNKVDYDATNDFSKVFIPWANVADLTPIIIIKGTTATGQFIESGFTTTPTVVTNDGDPYFKVLRKDLTSVEDDVIVGWKYDYDITLPKTYFRPDEKQKLTDFTANLTVNRMKFALGLSGVCGFKLKSTGVRQGEVVRQGDGVTTIFSWIDEDFNYVDNDQIKVKINGIESTAFTVSGDKQITLTNAATETKTLTGNNSTKIFDLTFTPRDPTKIKVKFKISGDWVLQDSTGYTLNNNYIHFTTAPPNASNNILVYSADDILIYLDEWYNIVPTAMSNTYLGNDIALSNQSVVQIPIHQRSDNFQLRIFNDSPFPVSLNSMMWEGHYSPRFYRRR